MTRAKSFWMAGLLALLPLGFSAQAADSGVTMLHKMDFEAVMSGSSNYIAPKDLGSGARAFPMSTNGGITFDATKVAGWNGSTNALGTSSSGGIRFRNGNGLGATTGTGWTLSFQAQANGAPGNPDLGPIGMTLGKVGEGDNLSLHLNVNISNNQGYALAVKRANTTDIAADKATVTVTAGTNMAPFAANEWHHYAVRCVPDAGGGQPTFELWQDGERKGAITVAGITDGTWVIKELLIGRTRGDGNQSTPLGSNSAYQSAPGSRQDLDEVALFDRALSAEGVAWLKDNAAAVPPADQPASVLGAVLGTVNKVDVGNASVSTIKFGSSELALTGPAGAEAIRAGTKLESVAVFFRSGSNAASNQNAKYLVLTDTSNVVLGVSDAAEPTPVANTIMTVAYTFTEAPTIDGTSSYRIYLTAQENVAAGDTFNTANAVTARFLALQKAVSSAEFGFDTTATNYAPAMTFSLRVPRALNVNFTVGESPLVDGTDYGVVPYPAAQWRNMTTENRGGDTGTITFSEALSDTTGSAITVEATARALENQNNTSSDPYPLFRDTLVDSHEAEDTVKVKISGIPYKLYDVYIYMAANAWDKNGSITLGTDTAHYYYMADGATEASVAETVTAWGDARPAAWGTPALGANVLCLRNLSGDEVKLTTWRRNPARGNICAIQVVEVPTNGLTVWSATLSADGAVSTQPFINTRGETKLLSELTEDDRAELTVAGAATLTLDAAAAPGQFALLGGGTLTLAGAQTLTTAIEVNEGTLAVAADAAALEGSTIKVASTAVLAPRATLSAQVTGAGSVTIEAGQTGALTNAANDFTGGTVVNGTLLWQGVEAYGPGAVTVNAGGIFDLNGLRCTQALTLNGGTLKGAVDAANVLQHAEVFSVNFNQDQGKLGNSETGGLVPMLGSYWMNTANASGANQALTLVPYDQIAVAGASTQALANALSWTCRGHWANSNNQTSYLKGYLDENSNSPVVLTFSLPEEKVKFGWDLYLYANTDTGGATFSAKDLTGDDGVTTSYTYSGGALVTGSTAGFGNSNTGTTTVAEGVNVLKVPGLTDRSLRVNSPNRNGRGCIAAVQGVFYQPNGYAGALTVAADSVLEVPEAGKTLFLAEATVSGSGTLTKQGAGALRLAYCTFGAQPLTVAEGTCVVAEGNTLDGVKLTVAAGAQVAPEAGVSALSVASLAGAGTVELGDLTALTLTGSGAGTASFEGAFTAATRDATLADAVCVLIKQGTNTQVLEQLPTTLTFEVQAQAGTLKVNAATAQTLERLVTTGGTFATDGVGEVSVEFAQMVSGAAKFASRATALSARPAMERAGDATVSKFTLADGGTILYQTRADLAKYFPVGFIPEGEYKLQLGADLYSELSFPYIFTVMGAPATARFTVRSSTGDPAPEGSWSASGNTITLNDSSAITGEVLDLGAPKYHYTFNNGDLVKADDAQEDGSLQDENADYEASDNGQCLASGTPWSGGFQLPSSAWSFGTYFRLKATQEKDVLFGFGQAGTPGALYLTKGAGNTATLWHNPTGSGIVELFTVQLAGSGETWNHLLLTHTEGTITCYVNGEQVAVAKGDFAKTLTQFQIGSMHGGVGHGFTKWEEEHDGQAGHYGQVDDLAVWSSVLMGRQVTQAATKVMGKWRWREGETPDEALDAAATDWQTVDGTASAWPATEADKNYTAAVTFSAAATLEELFPLTEAFTAREVLWDGAQVSFVARETALELPENAPRLAVANDLVVDLAGAELALTKAVLAGQKVVTLAEGAYSGEVTLRNVPEGLFVTPVVTDTGLCVKVNQAPALSGSSWEWVVSVDNRWDGAASGVLYGLDAIAVLGEHWNETHQGPGGASNNPINNPKKQDGSTLNGASVNFTFGGAIGYWSGYSDKVKKGYAPGPTRYAFSGLPAGEYAVVLYAASSNNVQASPVRVSDANGLAYYTYRGGELTFSETVPTAAWGQNNVDGYVVGQNTIVMPATANASGSIVVEISDSETPTAGPGLDWQTTVGRGYTAGIQLVKMKASEAYARTLTGNGTWNATGAWTKLADGTTVDVPPAGATVFLTVTADATLTMNAERPELMDLFVDGAGALTLDYGNLGLEEKADYANAPFERTLLAVEEGLPENLAIRTAALNYGAYATIAYTETAVVATVNAPEGLWQETGTERIISINFANAEANKVTGTAQEGLAGYEVHAALWSQFIGTSQTDQTVNAYDYADRANGSAAAVATGTLTYTAGTAWKTTDVDANARGLFKGYLDDNGINDWAGSTLRAEVTLPADWAARYTAILYKAADTNLDKTKFTAALINGVWYSYVNEELTSLANFPASALPGAEYDWGSLKSRQEYIAGTNVMVVSGLSGQTFTTEKWASRGAWTSFDARGGLAAIQLKEEKSLTPGEVKTFIAEASGNESWASLRWRDEGGQGTGEQPGANDAATIVLTGDLSLDLSGVAVKHLTIYGNGHAVRFGNRSEATVGSWAFVNDTTLALTEGRETLPANTVVYPKRVRYDYPYTGDVTTTTRYEQEFAAGFEGSLTPQGGLVEFSSGAVHFTGLSITGTETDFIFSRDTVVTLADGVPFSFGTANLTFKDNAKVTAKAMRLCDEGPARTVNLAMTDDATITITGNVNDSRGNNSLLWPHWAGTLNASLRDRAKVLAEQAVMVLGVADADTLQGRLTLADDAEVRVAGLYGYGSVAATSYDINLKGGKLLIGSRGGVAQEGIRPISLNFQGGTFGAWQDVEMLGDPARQLFTSVTGNPLFAGEATMTFTSPAPFFADPATRAILSSGGLVLRGKDFAALPSFQVLGGQLTLAGCAPEMGSLTLSGGSLELDAAFPTVSALSIPVDTIIHLPLREKLAEGGYITMANGRQIPALTRAVFELALDPDRSETSRVLPLVPLVLGGYTEGPEPQVKGFGVLNNTNSAISDYAAVFRSGSAGRGLYAELKGNEVLKEHTVHLNADTERLPQGGYPLIQSTLNAYPYHIFSGEQANAKVIVPEGGVALPHAAFIGTPITLVAQSSTPGTLLQGINYTFSTDVTFDLSAWAAEMPGLVRGAIKGVPASLCLMSGGAVKAPASVRLKVDFGSAYTLPAGVEASVETTAQGVYYVLRYERRARTLSVNFTESTVPLTAPPAQVGVYALPLTGWNSLEGIFSSTALKLSDVGGVAQEVAMGADDPAQSTQLLSYTSQTNSALGASAPLLQVWLDDSTEQQLRVAHIPFAAYRVALIFANDLEGAAYATAIINGSSYAMDAEGYTRRDITGYTALDAKGNPVVSIPADTQWGSTDFTAASTPVVLGHNALVSEVLTDSTLTLKLPGFTYGERYAGLAALQILEAPGTDAVGQILTCTYTFPAAGDYELSALTLGGSATTWENGPENILVLTSDHAITLTLPKGFEADRIICAGSGTITLRVAGNGGAALRELDAGQLANITVDFPATGLVFTPASGTSRFEQAFDNGGSAYTIAEGATLALGESSGIVTEFDNNGTATLDIDEVNSRGTLRRDYPVTQTSNISRSNVTFAFKQGTVTPGTNSSTYSILVEEEDVFRVTGKFFPAFNGELGTATPWHWAYTQTGGQASFEGSGGTNDGICCFSSDDGAADSSATFNISGDAQTRFQLNAIRSWSSGVAVQVNVSEEATLALGASGFYHRNRPNSSYTATFSGQATLEAIAATLGATNVTPTFNGGRLTTKQPEANFTLPMAFNGTEDVPTIVAPEAVSTLVLSGANSGTGKITVTQGTLAIANASALGNASVTVEAGATFESRNFTSGLSGKVSFAEGSTCSATSVTEPTGDYIAQIAGSIAFPADRSTVTFRLNGKAYTVADGDVDTANGTVIFRSAAQLPFEAVTWNTSGPGGEWAEGNGTPWVDTKRYWNGVGVTFPANPGEEAGKVGPIVGFLRPASLTIAEGDDYTFSSVDGLQGLLDLRDCVASDNTLTLGSGTTFDVPIALASPVVILRQGPLALRLLGVMSNGNKTATLIGSGNLTEAANHGIWADATYDGSITWMPHVGETQLLGAHQNQLAGNHKVTIAGQVAADGSVSGGTVQFAGAGGDSNTAFSGSFEVRDGATLDFTMTRGDDNNPYFRQDGNSLADREQPVFTLSNGATLRFTKCRNILGGYGQRTLASLIARQPIVVGYNCTLDYNYQSDSHQVLPYGLLLNGDGATIQINEKKMSDRQGIFVARGATITVAGIGDAGDLADPATDTTSAPTAETYGKLTRGITATIAGLNEQVGLVRLNDGDSAKDAITLEVRDGSTLRLLANLTHPGNASSDALPFRKTGKGRLTLEYPTIAARNTLYVDEGTLGGLADLTHADSAITVAAGTTIEGGLRVPTLTLGAGITVALDATGAKPLRCDRAIFTANSTVTVASLLPEAEIPAAAGREPVKVMGWNSAQNVDSVSFVLADTLVAAGYGLEVRTDGLYLMRNVTYVRELAVEETPSSLLVTWFSPNGWYRQDDPATLRDFDPAENETATALFLLPADRYATADAAPATTLTLTRAAAFSAVRFGVKVTEQVTDEGGNTVDREVIRLLPANVIYRYDLTQEAMPAAGEAYAFTWVSTRLVEGPSVPSLANVTASIPTGYAYTLLDTTVVVYASATTFTPALNLNFTGKSAGDPAWVGLDAGNCGAVPYAGVYWNNLSAVDGAIAEGANGRLLLRTQATVAGVTAEDGQAATCEVTFISSGAETVSSRRGTGNVSLSASFLKGQNVGNDSALLTTGGLSASGVNCGWQVQVKSLPFANCDLYLLFAGTEDGAVTYPPIRVKVGANDWRTYAFVNGYAAPAARNDSWAGRGSLVSGGFVNGTNMLHLRLSSALGENIEVCALDGQVGTPGAIGLAAMQIVQCTDGVSNLRLGTGNWSDPAGWARTTAEGQQTGRWVDATAEAPRWAEIPTTSYLTADMAAATPYLRVTGGSDLLLNGTEGILSTAAVDLYNALEGAKVTFGKNLFATAPNVVMAPNITVCVPESSGTTTCDFRWVYDDITRVGTPSTEGTLRKTQSGELILTRANLNKLQIDDGTLWLDSTADGNYARSTVITGQGTLGKQGTGTVTLAWNDVQQTGINNGNIIARVSAGTLALNAKSNPSALPADGILLAEGSGTLILQNDGGAQNSNTFTGRVVAENGGTFLLQNATNFFAHNADYSNTPTIVLSGGTFMSVSSNWGHPHLYGLQSSGLSRFYFDANSWSNWNNEGINLWSGRIIVEEGALAAHANTAPENNSMVLKKAVDDGFGSGGYLNVASGAAFYSDLPIQGVDDAIRKIGGGTWVQTRSVSQGRGNNGGTQTVGGGAGTQAANVYIHEGSLCLNLGANEWIQYGASANADTPRTLTVGSGARLEGAGALHGNTTVKIEAGGTLASGLPSTWSGISSAHRWYSVLPDAFKRIASGSANALHIKGPLELADGAILSFDLANAERLTVDGTITTLGNLTVRLTNLPTALTGERQLTTFASAPTGGVPTITCPEAVALDATVELKDDANGIKQLFLVPLGNAYTWADQNGSWSEAKWRHGEAENQSFPGNALGADTPPARVAASTNPLTLAVDKGIQANDGKDWAMKGLVLTAAFGRPITLTEELGTLPDPLPTGIGLNRLLVQGALWKLGAGSATIQAPVVFAGNGEGSLNIAASTLKLTHPLLVQQLVNNGTYTDVPAIIDIAEGATLEVALSASSDELRVINNAYVPTAQTLSGTLTGAGKLRLSGADNTLSLTGSVDNSLAYEVTGAGSTLRLGGTIPEAIPGATRTLSLAAGTTLALATESALGWAPWQATLAAAESDGAQVTTLENARFRGSVEVTGTGTATFGSARGYLDGATTFTVPDGATLLLGGVWQTPGTTASGTLAKRGTGTLSITGDYTSNLPLTIAEGTVELAEGGSLSVDEVNPDIVADWVVEAGAALRLLGSTQVNLNKGSLRVASGATLDLAGQSRNLVGKVELQDGAVIRIGGNGALGTTTFKSAVTANGTIWINLDAIDPADLASAANASYTLLNFDDSDLQGTGVFRLGGSKQVAWAQAGWTLRTTGRLVILEAFGGNNGVYTWAGTEDKHAWGDDGTWVLVSQGSDLQRTNWPALADVLKPYAAFLDTVTVANSDLSRVDYTVPEGAARTVNWALPTQTLSGLRCANDGGDYTLTAEGATDKTLSVDGEFLKTGTSALVIQRPLTLGANGALKFLGGTTRLEAALSGTTSTPLTLAGSAEFSISLVSGNASLGGLFTGDGTGTLRFRSTGNLTVAERLDGLATLAVDGGTVTLNAGEQYILEPTVELATGTSLAYKPSTLAKGGAVKLIVNPAASAPAGILAWGAAASSETAQAPRLSVAEGATPGVPSVNVAELRYAPASGHLTLDPGHAVLPATATLTMSNNASVATAFWMGARTDEGTAFDYAGLSGSGLVSVEPVIDPAADATWSTTRTLTLALEPTAATEPPTFRGTFAGALTADSTRIDAALTVTNGATDPAAGSARFVLAGASESTYLGPLTIGERTRVDVTGSWFGPVTVDAAGGELGGSGTVGSGSSVVTIPEGGLITASAIAARAHADGRITTELMPSTLTVGGTLSLVPGAKLGVVIRNNAQGAAQVSCVQAQRLRLPTIVDDPNNEVHLQVVIDDEADAIASNTKILGWNAIDGAGKINGTILGTDGTPRTDYILRQKADGLYLYRSASRFWMILR